MGVRGLQKPKNLIFLTLSFDQRRGFFNFLVAFLELVY